MEGGTMKDGTIIYGPEVNRQSPKEGWLFVLDWSTHHTTAYWYRNFGDAMLRLNRIAQDNNRTVERCRVDLTPDDGCVPSSAWVQPSETW